MPFPCVDTGIQCLKRCTVLNRLLFLAAALSRPPSKSPTICYESISYILSHLVYRRLILALRVCRPPPPPPDDELLYHTAVLLQASSHAPSLLAPSGPAAAATAAHSAALLLTPPRAGTAELGGLDDFLQGHDLHGSLQGGEQQATPHRGCGCWTRCLHRFDLGLGSLKRPGGGCKACTACLPARPHARMLCTN